VLEHLAKTRSTTHNRHLSGQIPGPPDASDKGRQSRSVNEDHVREIDDQARSSNAGDKGLPEARGRRPVQITCDAADGYVGYVRYVDAKHGIPLSTDRGEMERHAVGVHLFSCPCLANG
jgi:hypothetical protein